MNQSISLFVGTFTTLLAIINPFEVMPVYLQLLDGQDKATHRDVARKSCSYALALLFFFLVFGTLLLKLFDVPLSSYRLRLSDGDSVSGHFVYVQIPLQIDADPPVEAPIPGKQ